ncbi:LOW QUALITY PROTEIN: putative pentatricopeptide repeat-containing protein At1g56570 [Phalaenopsis equestris]|uniref:LOW QUALITY PROTEIN: putative pentatricopeptide repeat-containing protein At1g56570 n=1 Tax=Phalaenopsis equestris TaxID=78828 RepID=UPI0009E40941|nr:LOW QUALITY PROTEIN: putative pentatricopeptide repeat-containing protein At1g56570 [Phalaenopsis equestris]
MTKLPFHQLHQLSPLSPLAASTNLIKTYCNSGRLSDARQVFDEMPDRDVVSWTAMICGPTARPKYAWASFRSMASAGVNPNPFTLSSILTACKAMELAGVTAAVHALVIRRGIEGQMHVDNAMVDAYSACPGGIADARQVFDGISQRSPVSWTTIIAAYVRWGNGAAAVQMCHRMFQEGAELTPFTLSITARASAAVGSLMLGKQIHAATFKMGHNINLHISNAITDMYLRCMSFSDAKQYFLEMSQKDLITWNTMIAGLSCADSIDTFRLLLNMFSQSIQPNPFTFTSIISSCAKLSVLSFGQQVHSSVLQRGFGQNQQIANALIDMYAKCGSIADSQKVFHNICYRDLVSWTSMIIGYGVHGYGKEAIELFNEMMICGIQPDSILFMGVISACSHAGLVEEGLNFFNLMERMYGVHPDKEVYGCVIDLLGRSGRLTEASELIAKMPFEPDESLWGALLGACKMHSNVNLGSIVARKILNLKPKGAKTYVIVSNIYAAMNEWASFAEMRKLMRGVGGKKEVGISWIEVRDEVYRFVASDRSNPCVSLASEVLAMLIYHMDREMVGL